MLLAACARPARRACPARRARPGPPAGRRVRRGAAGLPGGGAAATLCRVRELDGKDALVTGGSGDIGRAICVALAARGARVAYTYFSDHEGAARTARAVEDAGAPPPRALRVNFGDAQSTAQLLAQVQAELPRVDLLVHNAASGVFRASADLQPRHLQWSLDVNVRSLLLLVQALRAPRGAAPPALGPGAAVVALSSLGAARAIPQYLALGASKAALESLVRHLALELGPAGVRVNVVSPGLVLTRALDHMPTRDYLTSIARERTPLGRLCTPADVAEVVAFLCGERAAMIHGQTLHVDGGYSIVG